MPPAPAQPLTSRQAAQLSWISIEQARGTVPRVGSARKQPLFPHLAVDVFTDISGMSRTETHFCYFKWA